MEEIRVFNNEEFGEIRGILIDGKPWFVGKDVASALGYKRARNAIATHIDSEDKKGALIQGDLGGTQEMTIINESGLYTLILSSKLESAKKFKKWVTSEVLPSLREYGTYSLAKRDSYMIEDSLERAKRWIEEEKERRRLQLKNEELVIENKSLTTEVMHKEDVIVGLVDNIDLTEQRRRITQIVRYGTTRYCERYNLLYREFEMKYHLDLNRRMNSDECLSMKPKIKNKMDYIDRVMHKIPELYGIACKLFENDVQKLQEEIWSLAN